MSWLAAWPISCTRFSSFFSPWNRCKTFLQGKTFPIYLSFYILGLYTGEGTGKLVSFENVTPKSLSRLKYPLAKQPLNNKRCSRAFSAVPVHKFVINTMQHILQIFQSSQVHDTVAHTMGQDDKGWHRWVQHGPWLQVYIDNHHLIWNDNPSESMRVDSWYIKISMQPLVCDSWVSFFVPVILSSRWRRNTSQHFWGSRGWKWTPVSCIFMWFQAEVLNLKHPNFLVLFLKCLLLLSKTVLPKSSTQHLYIELHHRSKSTRTRN